MFDSFVAGKADAVVGDGDRTGFLVERHADLEVAIITIERRIVQRFEAQLVAGIRGVGNQLAQEDFLVAVQRVDHQVQQLLDFGLKAQRFLVCAHQWLRKWR